MRDGVSGMLAAVGRLQVSDQIPIVVTYSILWEDMDQLLTFVAETVLDVIGTSILLEYQTSSWQLRNLGP